MVLYSQNENQTLNFTDVSTNDRIERTASDLGPILAIEVLGSHGVTAMSLSSISSLQMYGVRSGNITTDCLAKKGVWFFFFRC